jgi:hypothetical protein
MRQEMSPTGRFSFPVGTRHRSPPGVLGVVPTAPQWSGGNRCGRRSLTGLSYAALKNSTHWAVVTSIRPMRYS